MTRGEKAYAMALGIIGGCAQSVIVFFTQALANAAVVYFFSWWYALPHGLIQHGPTLGICSVFGIIGGAIGELVRKDRMPFAIELGSAITYAIFFIAILWLARPLLAP